MDKKTTNNLVECFEKNGETTDMQKVAKKICEEYESYIKEKRELVEKTDYIRWLERFTKEHPSFSDDTWLYKQDEISKEDYVNVCKICKLFSAIEVYASKNYISGTPCDYGEYYSIEYNGKVYEIGTVVGQGAISFCNTEDVDKEVNIIKFEDIATPSEETCRRTLLINVQLKKIDILFKELANNKKLNIPIEAIIARTDKVLTELKKK